VHQRIEDMDQRTEGAIDAFIPEGTRALYAALASRDRLGWARVALAWARLALAMVLLPLLLVLLGGSPSPRHWLQAGGGLAVVILAWQAGHTLLIRGARLIRNRENAAAWSRRTRTAVALAIALAAALSPWDFLQVTAYFLAYVAAVAASGEQRHIAAMVLGVLLLAMDWMLVSWGLDMPLLWRGFTGLALTPLVILGWDALLARRKGKPLDPVTGLGGSLWPLVALVAALVVIQFNLVMRL
jgi:hypothetical protein